MQYRPTLSNPAILLATWFGSGYIKPAPGTWGTLAGLPFAWIILQYYSPLFLIIAALLLFPVGVWAADRFDRITNGHDASEIVIDEVVGVWLTLGMIILTEPAIWVAHEWVVWMLSFLLFRLFDITKPFPIRLVDRSVQGGFGVMVDDVLAGLVAGAAGILALRVLSSTIAGFGGS